jgi:predicted GTPase
MGAAGRDFHNFLVRYREDDRSRVVAFTATQIPGIEGRSFPAELAGPAYPDGIPVVPESDLVALIDEQDVDTVVFAYSDVDHAHVMHAASTVLSAGADFVLLGPDSTQIRADVPVVSVCAVRTGVGKSAITRQTCRLLASWGLSAVAIRHPMPYRDLSRQAVERFETVADLTGITLEEREEFEPLVESGVVVYAGVDYRSIVEEASREAEVIVWDGGNNDMPFVASDLEIVAIDPHRLGHEVGYYPGEANFLRADVLVMNKVDSAPAENIAALERSARTHNPDAELVKTRSVITADDERLAGRTVLVVEDGPTVTHGNMSFGAGFLAAERAGAAQIVDPRPYAQGSLKGVFEQYDHLEAVLPAMGYSPEQLSDLAATIAAAPADVVAIGTPVDLARVIDIEQESVRVTYGIADAGEPTLSGVLDTWARRTGLL